MPIEFTIDFDTSFSCDCKEFLMYNSKTDVGKVVTCKCGVKWKIVSDEPVNEAVEKVVQDGRA